MRNLIRSQCRLCRTGTRDHIIPVLQSLHWLPISFRIIYKLCVLKHLVRVGRSPACLSDMMTSDADLPGRERLRSSSSFQYELPQFKLSSASGVPRSPDRMRGILFRIISRSSQILILSKYFWKLTFSSSHSENLNDFVDAPLVTVGVIGVWNDVM